MKSLSEISGVLEDDATRLAFKQAAEKEALEREIDEIVNNIPEDELEDAIKAAQEAVEQKKASEEVEKIASDYVAAGRFMAIGFKEEIGNSIEKAASVSDKVDSLLEIFKKAGVDV